MPLSPDDIARIDALLTAAPPEAEAAATLRQAFPKLSLTRCDAADMGMAEAFRETEGFELYLVDGSDHCWKLTNDPAAATGLVVAARRKRR